MRGRNLTKFFRTITLLSQPCGTTLEELERELLIQKRQVYRLLESLQDDHGLVLDEEKLDGGGKRISLASGQQRRLSDVKVPDLSLTMGEIVALHFLRGHAGLYQGTGIGEEIERAFIKLSAFVPDKLIERMGRLRSLFVPSVRFAKDYRGFEEVLDALSEALLAQRACVVEYHSFSDDETKRFRIDPLRFFERDGGVYLFVRVPRYDDIRVLAVERITSIDITEDSFEYPKDFDPEELLQQSFGMVYDDPVEVTIWFSADQTRYIQERQWAKDQKITQSKDGSIELWMNTSGWYDVKRWILSFGADACLISPDHLRDEIKLEAEKVKRLYEKITFK